MQSDVPPLPISCLTNGVRSRSNSSVRAKSRQRTNRKVTPRKSIPSSNGSAKVMKNNNNKKDPSHAVAESSPYSLVTRCNPSDVADFSNKSTIDRRISSARMLRIKQLQNQLTDAHFHLNELANENKLLKAIQKRQEVALQRYEDTEAKLPKIISTYQEDFRVLQVTYKKLRSQYKETIDTLKKKEDELHLLQAQNKKLLQLSKNRQLLEREKLEDQVLDLSHRLEQQDGIIQTLKRKLELESKYLKHQLYVEMAKHKETQKHLEETRLKLENLERFVEISRKGQSRFRKTKGHSLPSIGDLAKTRRNQSPENSRDLISRSQRKSLVSRTRESFANLRLRESSSLSLSSSPRDATAVPSISSCQSGVKDRQASASALPKSQKENLFFQKERESAVGDRESHERDIEDKWLCKRSISSAAGAAVEREEPRTGNSSLQCSSNDSTDHAEKVNENDPGTKFDRDSAIITSVISRSTCTRENENREDSHSDAETATDVPDHKSNSSISGYLHCDSYGKDVESLVDDDKKKPTSVTLFRDESSSANNSVILRRRSVEREIKKSDYYFYDFNDGSGYHSLKSGSNEDCLGQKKAVSLLNQSPKGFDKAKLLAAMKAIDDDENSEFIEQKPRENVGSSLLQVTENSYKGSSSAANSDKKSKVMKEIFSDLIINDNNINKN